MNCTFLTTRPSCVRRAASSRKTSDSPPVLLSGIRTKEHRLTPRYCREEWQGRDRQRDLLRGHEADRVDHETRVWKLRGLESNCWMAMWT